jgi:hypothetical protein
MEKLLRAISCTMFYCCRCLQQRRKDCSTAAAAS